MRRKLYVIAFALAFLSLVGWTYAERPVALSWEYKVVPIKGDAQKLEESLNGFGREGWEVVVAFPETRGGNTDNRVIYHLKRPK